MLIVSRLALFLVLVTSLREILRRAVLPYTSVVEDIDLLEKIFIKATIISLDARICLLILRIIFKFLKVTSLVFLLKEYRLR